MTVKYDSWGVMTPEGLVIFRGMYAYSEAVTFFQANKAGWPLELQECYWPCINIDTN